MVAGTDTTFTLTDITSGEDDAQDAIFYVAGVDLDSNENPQGCLGSDTVEVTVTAPQFAAPTSVIASSCALAGGTNYDASLTITITVGIFVPENGNIIIEFL